MQQNFSWRFFFLWAVLAVFLAALAYATGWVPVGVSALGDRLLGLAGGPGGAGGPSREATVPADTTPRIVVPEIGIRAPLVFPAAHDLDTLNRALERGVVHYPGSALPGERGTVFLFGHSTGRAVVRNGNFSVFNRVSELRGGDVIRLGSGLGEHWYRVRSVEIKRTDAAVVDLSNRDDRVLVITTCRVFGGEDDRYVVTADFVGSYLRQESVSAAGSSLQRG